MKLSPVWVCDLGGCGHIWFTADGSEPARCAKCKRPNWNQESAEPLPFEFIYVMYNPDTGLHKIGRSSDPERRRKTLGASLSLIFSAKAPYSSGCEFALHRHFSSVRHHGEWFKLTANDLQWIKDGNLYHPVSRDPATGFKAPTLAIMCQCHPLRFISNPAGRSLWHGWTPEYIPTIWDSGSVAQPVERRPHKPLVVSSSPTGTTRPAHAPNCSCGMCRPSK